MWRLRDETDRFAGPALLLGIALACAFNLLRLPGDVRRARELRRRAVDAPPGFGADAPRVSVLVAAWNECELIERHVDAVRRLRYPNLEHIICAGGDDGTYELAERHQWPGLKLIRQSAGEGQQQAVARALNIATGAIVVLTDADSLMNDTSFARLLAPIVSDGESVTTGPFKPLDEQLGNTFVVHRWAATMYRYLQAGSYVVGLTGANSAVLTEALKHSRALDEPVWMGMDVHLATRLRAVGHQTRFVHLAEPSIHFEESFASFARQRSRWLGGIFMHALSARDLYQVAVVGAFYAVGQAFVWLPLSVPVLGRVALSIWVAGVMCAILNRLRYLAFTSLRTGRRFNLYTYAASVVLVPRDLSSLAYAPLDMLLRLRTRSW